MTNAQKFQETFGIYATEMWAMPEHDFLKWLNADTPQTERMKTHDYCDICNHKGCGTCIANNLDDYCVPSNYEPTTQTETQNSNLTFENRTMLDCYNCKRYKSDDACVECRYEPKDTPQTDLSTEEFVEGMKNLKMEVKQTDCGWK